MVLVVVLFRSWFRVDFVVDCWVNLGKLIMEIVLVMFFLGV